MKKVLLVLGLSLFSGMSACKVTEVVKTPVVADSVTTITVSPNAFTLTVGQQQQFTATLLNAAGGTVTGKTVTWRSSDPSRATVSPSGVVTGVSAGAVIIYATSGDVTGQTVAAVINIPVSVVVLTPSSTALFIGQTTTPRIEIRGPSNELLTNRFVEWTSLNTAVATVTQLGTITAVGPGTTTIRATSEGRSANFTLTVNVVPASSVSISATNNFFIGRSTQLSLNIRDSVGNLLSTAGRSVTWTTSNPSIATISNMGVVTGLFTGTTTVAALVDSRLATFNVMVGIVDIDSIIVAPNDTTSLRIGFTRQFTATAFDRDGGRIETAALAGRTFNWASDTPSLLSVSNGGLTLGVATGDATFRVWVGDKVTRRGLKVTP